MQYIYRPLYHGRLLGIAMMAVATICDYGMGVGDESNCSICQYMLDTIPT